MTRILARTLILSTLALALTGCLRQLDTSPLIPTIAGGGTPVSVQGTPIPVATTPAGVDQTAIALQGSQTSVASPVALSPTVVVTTVPPTVPTLTPTPTETLPPFPTLTVTPTFTSIVPVITEGPTQQSIAVATLPPLSPTPVLVTVVVTSPPQIITQPPVVITQPPVIITQVITTTPAPTIKVEAGTPQPLIVTSPPIIITSVVTAPPIVVTSPPIVITTTPGPPIVITATPGPTQPPMVITTTPGPTQPPVVVTALVTSEAVAEQPTAITQVPLPTMPGGATMTGTPGLSGTATLVGTPIDNSIFPAKIDGARGDIIDNQCNYKAVANDRLVRIAQRFDRTIVQLLEANRGILNANLIYPDEIIKIPDCMSK